MSTLDHLVVAAHTLDQGATFIERRLGVAPCGGGRHPAMGTHNRLLNLGQGRYLEIIAVDPEAQPPASPRWYGLDDPDLRTCLAERPRLVAWAARTRAIERLARADRQQQLDIRSMQRGHLQWRFAFTVDGSLPGDGLIPHLIQWQGPHHPTQTMPASGCRLLRLEGFHPRGERIHRIIKSMSLDDAITISPASDRRPTGLVAHIETPAGVVRLD